MMRMLPIALLLATPCAAATMPSPNWPAPADRGEAQLRNTVLATHNAARARFGVPALSWSDELVADALGYART
ncbi:MAG: serine protease, partial [Sphingomicrobium sp.]